MGSQTLDQASQLVVPKIGTLLQHVAAVIVFDVVDGTRVVSNRLVGTSQREDVVQEFFMINNDRISKDVISKPVKLRGMPFRRRDLSNQPFTQRGC